VDAASFDANVTMLTSLESFISGFIQLFDASAPTEAQLNNIFHTDFVLNGNSKIDIVGYLSTISGAELESFQVDIANMIYFSLESSSTTGGVTTAVIRFDSEPWTLVDEGSGWQFMGNGRNWEAGVEIESHRNQRSGAVTTDFYFGGEGSGLNANDYVVVTGPTLPTEGYAYAQYSGGDYGGSPTGLRDSLSDAQISSLTDGAEFTFSRYSDGSGDTTIVDGVITGGDVDDALVEDYVSILPKAPQLPSEIAAFPTISTPTVADLANFSSGSLPVSWTLPAGLHSGDIMLGRTFADGSYDRAETDVSPTATSGILNVTAPGTTVSSQVVVVFTRDAYDRTIASHIWVDPAVDATDTGTGGGGTGGGGTGTNLVEAAITVDGLVDDWSGVTPILIDPQGDQVGGSSSTDLVSLSAVMNGDNMVLLMETAGPITMPHTPAQAYSHYEVGISSFSDSNCSSEIGFVIANNFTASDGTNYHQLDSYIAGVDPTSTVVAYQTNYLETSFNAAQFLAGAGSFSFNPYIQSFDAGSVSTMHDEENSYSGCYTVNSSTGGGGGSATLSCATESGWDDAAGGGLGAPITPYSFADFEIVVADCGTAQAFARTDIAGTAFDDLGETTTFNDTGAAATMADPEAGSFDDGAGFVANFEWYIEPATCSGCSHSYLVIYTNETISGGAIPAGHEIRETNALTGVTGSSFTFKTYSEGINYGDMVRSTGADGEIWGSTKTLIP
jgi:hypothetical protein